MPYNNKWGTIDYYTACGMAVMKPKGLHRKFSFDAAPTERFSPFSILAQRPF